MWTDKRCGIQPLTVWLVAAVADALAAASAHAAGSGMPWEAPLQRILESVEEHSATLRVGGGVGGTAGSGAGDLALEILLPAYVARELSVMEGKTITFHTLCYLEGQGQGASFGYPLVSRIGQSLCRLIAPGRSVDEDGLKLAQAHLDALKLVLDQKIAGKGGETGDKLAARLESLTAAADH